MSFLTRLKQFLFGRRDPDKPSCPGCGKPMASAGDVCASCGSDHKQEPGG